MGLPGNLMSVISSLCFLYVDIVVRFLGIYVVHVDLVARVLLRVILHVDIVVRVLFCNELSYRVDLVVRVLYLSRLDASRLYYQCVDVSSNE